MKTIVWDVDDVLNELMKSWFENEWLPGHLTCRLTYQNLTKNPSHEILNVTLNDYLDSLDHFRLSLVSDIFRLEPVPQVLDWFKEHGDKFRHIALTATPAKFASFSAAWVIQHFGRWIRSFNFVPSVRAEEEAHLCDLTKADYLRWWGRADILIDDNPVNIKPVARMGIRTIMMPKPWNANAGSIETTLNSLLSG